MNKILLIIFMVFLTSAKLMADVDLYAGEVIVTSQSETDRNEAVPQALLQVLEKLSGLRDVPFSPALEEALENASGLLRSIRYTNVERAGPDGVVDSELHLIASFMQSQVDLLLQQSGLPRWQQERPSVQVWVLIDDGLNRDLKPVEFEYAWMAMEDLASSRGLPLSWPDMDEEALQLVDMRLVWGGFTDYLIERGAPGDGVAIIAARREGPEWTLRWNFANEEKNWSWSNADQDLMFALAEGVHQMTDQIAATNAITVSDQVQTSVDIVIGGLLSARDYISCLEYLENLSLVTNVDVLGAEPGRVNFRLQLNAASEFLTEAFNRGSVISTKRVGSDYEYEFIR